MKKILFLSLLILPALFSCQKELGDCFKSRGSHATESKSLTPFTSVIVYDKIDLIILKDSINAEHADLDGWKIIIPNISFDVQDGVLSIHDNTTCDFVRDLNDRTTVTVYFKQLLNLEVHDNASAASGKRLYLDSLVVKNHGVNDISLDMKMQGTLTTFQYSANNITLKGSAPVFVTVMEDVSGMDASRFRGDFTYVFQDSPRDCYVNPLKELGGQITYSGNVYYNTVPWKLSIEKKGSGNCIKQ